MPIQIPDDPNQLRGKRALLLGLGSRQGGLGVAQYLVEQGAEVRVSDLRQHDLLAESLSALADLPITYTLGEHRRDDIEWADVIVRNPAVPRESPWLALARELGKRVEMEMTLFFRACPAPIAGVTGTKGKTTTTTLLHAMLRERWPNAVLAGNMGRSALQQLVAIEPDVPVALELSSFQLEGLDEHHLSPHVAVITNISPDHLDRYASLDAYAEVKGAIARWQRRHMDYIVFNPGDPLSRAMMDEAPGQWVLFATPYRAGWKPDLWIEDDAFFAAWEHQPEQLALVSELRVPGEHSRLNALAAAGAALALGVSPAEIRRAIVGFAGVPHRLEQVATIDSVEYVNDTAATNPTAGVAALRAYAGRRIIAITGGFDKRLPMEPLAEELARRAETVVLLDGTVTPRIAELLHAQGYDALVGPCASMGEAVRAAASQARAGDVVLLSPGCASFGMFRDEFHRGEMFRAAVHALETDAAS